MLPQIGCERLPIELFGRSDVAGVSLHRRVDYHALQGRRQTRVARSTSGRWEDAVLEPPDRMQALAARVRAFMEEHVIPNEATFHRQVAEGDRWQPAPIVEELKPRAKAAGLWNLFLPESEYGAGLTNMEYAPLCEIMGRVPAFGPEVFNCSAPDTGNMEVLVRYGTAEQKRAWLEPLLAGDIRSCFAMTEPDVASSDATNIRSSVVRQGGEYVVNGRKWYISGAGDPRCKLAIFMGRSNVDAPRHRQQSMILVPMDAPGITISRMMPVFGYDDAPHGHAELTFEDVRVPVTNILLGEGRGFEIAQGRLGPGRIHHCMRLIGLAERALEAMCRRVLARVAFGRPLAEQGTIRADIANARMEIDQARLLTLKAAHLMDTVGNKAARREIAMIKVVVPNVAQRVIDRAIQAHGAAGVSDDLFLARAWAHARSIRLADGPDEVHREALAALELRRYTGNTTEKEAKDAPDARIATA
jgi:acyl-CoA dehydrogenase